MKEARQTDDAADTNRVVQQLKEKRNNLQAPLTVLKTKVPKCAKHEGDHGCRTETKLEGLKETMRGMKGALERQAAAIKQLQVRGNELEQWIKAKVENIVQAGADNVAACDKPERPRKNRINGGRRWVGRSTMRIRNE